MRPWHIVSLVLVLLAIGGYWFFKTNFEWVERSEDVGYSGEARKNPFLAAQRLLKQLNYRIDQKHYYNDLEALSSENQTLFIQQLSTRMSAERREKLMQWIQQGGHLITVPSITGSESSELEEDIFLHNLGIELYRLKEDSEDESSATDFLLDSKKFEQLFSTETKENNYRVPFTYLEGLPLNKPYQAQFDRDYYLVSHGDIELEYYIEHAEEPYTYHLLQFTVGEGRVTVLSNESIFYNLHIANFDHAYLLSLLFHHHDPTKNIRFIHDLVSPNLLELIWQHGYPVVIAVLILLLLTIWLTSRRFGPLIKASTMQQRAFSEHLIAFGRLLWQHKQHAALLKPALVRFEQAMQRRYRNWQQLSTADKRELFIQYDGIKPNDVDLVLSTASAIDKEREENEVFKLKYHEFIIVIRTVKLLTEKALL